MGVIGQRLKELEPEIRELCRLAETVDTSRRQVELEETVLQHFKALSPLSYKTQQVSLKIDSGDRRNWPLSSNFRVGKWISILPSLDCERGAGIPSSVWFKLIRMPASDLFSLYIKKEIRGSWIRLAELTRRLKPYPPITQKIPIRYALYHPLPWNPERRISYREGEGTLILASHGSCVITVHTEDGEEHFNLWDLYFIPVLDEYVHDIKRIYDTFNKEVQQIEAFNRPILEEMRTISLPYTLASSI